MISRWSSYFRAQWDVFSRTPFGCLTNFLARRMLRGGREPGVDDLNLGFGAVMLLLFMPGFMVSVFLFVSYGSLMRFLRGAPTYNLYLSTLPDEYLFIVLAMVTAGTVALWHWNTIFLHRREFAELEPLPLSTRQNFFANIMPIIIFTSFET